MGTAHLEAINTDLKEEKNDKITTENNNNKTSRGRKLRKEGWCAGVVFVLFCIGTVSVEEIRK